MTDRLKFLFALFVIMLLVFACSGNKSDKDKGNQTTQQQQQQLQPKDQYRIGEMYEDDKYQMIDLIEGKATFNIVFEGEGIFKANLLYTDGSPFEVLADVKGSYKDKKVITIPQTSAYILDVHCKGKWSINKE